MDLNMHPIGSEQTSGLSQEDSFLGPARSGSIASMVFGIASIPTFCFVLGIIGLALANQGLKRTPVGAENRFAKVGRICSIIGIVISVLLICSGLGYLLFGTGSGHASISF